MKSGIGVTGSPPAKQRKKPFIHDGALNRALVQLTLKVHHLDPYGDEDRKKVKPKARKLAKKIWKKTRKMMKIKKSVDGGRVGEALGPAPLKKRGFNGRHPCPLGRASCESRSMTHIIRLRAPHSADRGSPQIRPNPPLFTPDTYQFTASMGSLSSNFKNPPYAEYTRAGSRCRRA
jgi:hypothetical protein